MSKKVQKITSIDDLVKYQQGTMVELPAFAEGQPFIARLKRPSLLAMVKSKKIPNKLLTSANTLFAGKELDIDNENAMDNMFEIFDIVCDACFVEPTYQAMKDADIELTDDQYVAVFNYSQKGLDGLNAFRKDKANIESDNDVDNVSQDTVGVITD